jgi:DNA polymerase-4
MEIAKQIRQAIKDELNLTASAGVSINKFVAKVASGMNKPDGLTFIGPSNIEHFMETLPVEKFHGVGKVTAEKMKAMGLHHGTDLKKLTLDEMVERFGKSGRFYYNIVRGIDEREVQPYRETKSLGAEDTFAEDLTTAEAMYAELDKIAKTVCDRLQRYSLKGRTITVKIKYHDFKLITRSQSLPYLVGDIETIANTAKSLLISSGIEQVRIRLLGISLANFELGEPKGNKGRSAQLSLFDD